jgi:hypothetical protein
MTVAAAAPPLYRRQDDAVRGRHLVAAQDIEKGRLVFAERPLLMQQNLTNVREAWVCRACHAFLGGPIAAIRHRFPPSSTSSANDCKNGSTPDGMGTICDHPSACASETVVPCRKGCGYAYCSSECERDAWDCHHRWLCTGWTENPDHPLVQFKRYAAETNEVLLAAAEWWIAQHASAAARRRRWRALGCVGTLRDDDEEDEQRVYTDFVMNPWWDVSVLDLLHAEPDAYVEAIRIQKAQKEICEEAARLLNRALAVVHCGSRDDNQESGGDFDVDANHELDRGVGGKATAASVAAVENNGNAAQRIIIPPISAVDVAARLGAFSQNAIGFRSRHPLCRCVYDPDFRRACHSEIVLALDQAGFLEDCPDDDEEEEGRGDEQDDSDPGRAPDEPGDVEVEPDPSQNSLEEIALLLSQLFVDEDGTVTESNVSSSEGTNNLAPSRARDTTGDDLDYVFPPLDGTALYATACKMNHSCDPNVIVLFRRSSFGRLHPLVAHCVALRDISRDEELTISYIENGGSYSERQLALSSYGFTCRCTKCQRETSPMPPTDDEDKAGAVEGDLFGREDETEDDFSENGDQAVAAEGSTETQDEVGGELALEQILERLDSRSNFSQYGSVPTPIAARLFAYLIQQGTTLIQQLGQVNNPPAAGERSLLAKCVDGARERDFCLCRVVGCDLEGLLYNQLRRRGSWQNPTYREAYWCAVLSAAVSYAHDGNFLESLALLDKGLVLGLPRSHHSLRPFVDYVETHASQMAVGPLWPCVSAVVPNYRLADHRHAVEEAGLVRSVICAIEERHTSLPCREFRSTFVLESKPVILRGYASEWKALDTMRELCRLARYHGHRRVPIEIGSILTQGSNGFSMKEEMMTIRHFVDSFLTPSTDQGIWGLKDAVGSLTERVAYMAQHALIEQIPALGRDVIMIPDLCGTPGPSHVNAWVGTGGTRTPLHFDSYDNLLVQLVGVKYVRLYATEDTYKLPKLAVNVEASAFGLQGNMSSLNCECEDRDESGRNEDFKYSEALLFPGDCLFIPSRVWHYVRSITTSVSINYWFDVPCS